MKSRETNQRKPLTLGSLFDGSGGFPLAGILAGVKPVWASEIEPFAIRVTTKRLPKMQHYGGVSGISGTDLEPVDIITFGSPCQDLSIAGKRSGLDGSRSGLFFEAARIVKEMREKTHGEKPRFRLDMRKKHPQPCGPAWCRLRLPWTTIRQIPVSALGSRRKSRP